MSQNSSESVEKAVSTDPSQAAPQKSSALQASDDFEYPSNRELLLILPAVFVAVFLVALDRLIIGVAIPNITNEFHDLNDVGWFAGAYLLTASAFQLIFGRLYTFYSVKWVFLSAIVLFEVGSALCAAAPNAIAFILGRAVAGSGSGGIFSGAIVIITYVLPLQRRPAFQGIFGAVFGISSVLGPLVGGAFTDSAKLTWRWCFWINLPIGGVTILMIAAFLHLKQEPYNAKLSATDKLIRMDPLGNLFFMPSVICLLLALQWGGTTYAWNSARIISLLVLFGVLAIAFVAVQLWNQEMATVPPRIVNQRSIAAGIWYSFFSGAAFLTMVYFLPLYFQAIQNVDAVQSGIRILPLVIALVIFSMASGILVSKLGYYTPFMIAGSILMPIGLGLISTLGVDSPSSHQLGYQVIFGIAMGMSMQMPNIAAQTVLERRDVASGAALMLFAVQLGGAIWTSVGNTVFNNKLVAGLSATTGLNAQAIVQAGATNLRHVVPAADLPAVLIQYSDALRACFYTGVAAGCVAIFGALAMEWRSVRKPQPGGNPQQGATTPAANAPSAVSSDLEKGAAQV